MRSQVFVQMATDRNKMHVYVYLFVVVSVEFRFLESVDLFHKLSDSLVCVAVAAQCCKRSNLAEQSL